MPPLEFIRLLACVDRSLQPLRTPGCRRFTPIPGDGWSHHPWAWRHPPEYRTRSDDARIGDLPRLQRLLDALVARHRLAPGLRDLWITEFGYEPNVPVRTRPWSLAQQARLLPRAERIAWADPHVRSWGQFLLRDVETFPAVLASSFGEPRPVGSWQTGLLFESGAPKPAARSFRLALVVGARGLWGHVRPADGPVQVEVQRRVPGTTWKRVALVRTAPDGTFAYAPAGGSGRAAWRYAWRSATGTETSPATSP